MMLDQQEVCNFALLVVKEEDVLFLIYKLYTWGEFGAGRFSWFTLERFSCFTPRLSRNASTGHNFSSTLCTRICGKRVTTVANSLPCAPIASRHATVGSNFPNMLRTSNCGQRPTIVGSFRFGTPILSSRNSQFGRNLSSILATCRRMHLLI